MRADRTPLAVDASSSIGVHDPAAMRRNVHRVLLTRGRDGSVVFLPPTPEYDETAAFLLACGFRQVDGQA